MRKRKINSEAELVNALCKDIKVDKYSIDGVFIESITFDNIMKTLILYLTPFISSDTQTPSKWWSCGAG